MKLKAKSHDLEFAHYLTEVKFNEKWVLHTISQMYEHLTNENLTKVS